MTPIIGIFKFCKASLHRFSCFLLPILLRIIPDIREFSWNFVKPNAVAAIERDVLLASSTRITDDSSIVAT
jgi:hypothetical protein